MSAARIAKRLLFAATLLASAGALAAEVAQPSAPATAAGPSPAAPSPAALAAADTILDDMGVKATLALVVPGMMTELERNVTNTRPEIKGSLRETLKAIQPEFDKSAQDMFKQAATLLATLMSDKEIEEAATFFSSPVGKKYLATEPVFFQKFSALAEPWRQQLSTNILTKAREEMKKKGIDF